MQQPLPWIFTIGARIWVAFGVGLAVAASFAIALIASDVGGSAAHHRHAGTTLYAAAPGRALRIELPDVEPLRFQPMPPAMALAINNSTPFVVGPNPPAKPYHFAGSAAEREKALTCLAVAGWFEAGDDPQGEQAVMQVVLNRSRHAVFPRTVCGVVFQGSDRGSGCQFTFTCNGAMAAKEPSPEAWARARLLASKALDGGVDAAVGWATHYHAQTVVPYWSATLDKSAQIGAHIFYRWHGSFGAPGAFGHGGGGAEQLDPRLVAYTQAKLPNDAKALTVADARVLSASGQSGMYAALPHKTIFPAPTTLEAMASTAQAAAMVRTLDR